MKLGIGWIFGVTIASAAQVQAQVRPPPTVNPLQNLPQVQAPSTTPHVSTQVQAHAPNPQLTALLSHTLTPQRFDVTGVHALPFGEIAALFRPMTGKRVRVADLIAASDRITAIYKAHGYALSFGYIPAQDFGGEVVRITVVEGYVAKVDVNGDPGNLEPRIRAIARHIAEDRPLRQATFERYLQVLGMLPGVRINASVPAPTTTDGATRLVLQVQRTRFNVSSAIDFNHPGTQGLLSATENGLTPLGEQFGISALYPPGRDSQRLYAANYLQPIGSRGLMSSLNGSRYSGNPDIDHQLPSYLRHTMSQNRLALVLSYPLLLDNQHNLSASIGAYGSDQRDRYRNAITGASLEQRSDLRVLHTGIDYGSTSSTRVRKFSFEVSHGLDAWGADASTVIVVDGHASMTSANAGFTRYNTSFVQSDAWPHRFGTVFSMIGQYSRDTLPSTEQINFGGQRYGLAYDPGDAAGDSGWGAALEFNRHYDAAQSWFKRWTPYVAMQIARVHLNAGKPPTSRLGSAALGLRLSDNRHYTVDLSVAQPTGDKPLEANHRKPRWNLAFSYQLH